MSILPRFLPLYRVISCVVVVVVVALLVADHTIFSCNQLMLFLGGVGGVCKVIFVSNPTTVLRLCYVLLLLGL